MASKNHKITYVAFMFLEYDSPFDRCPLLSTPVKVIIKCLPYFTKCMADTLKGKFLL